MTPEIAYSGVASSVGGEFQWFFWVMVIVCGAASLGIGAMIIYSMVRFRRHRENQMGSQTRYNMPIEVAWTVIPLFIFMGMFAYGAKLYFDIERPPDNAMPIYVVAKQWMWKLEYPNGQREINTLHVPVGVPVKLTMVSQDVIHSFFVPAFRIKQDVLPGRYTSIWFEATVPGKYHLFCAEYCGTKHSGMIGWVYAMEPREYQTWSEQGGAEGSLAAEGEKIFHQYACANCHHFDNQGRGPDLRNLYGTPVQTTTGAIMNADDTFIRQHIIDPRTNVPNGFAPIMPSFQGQISEEQILAIIAFIRAIGPQTNVQEPTSSGSTPAPYATQGGIAGPGATSNSQTPPERR